MAETETLERVAYSPAEVASILGRSRSWLYSEMNAGAIRSVKCGGARLIPAEVISELLAGAA